MSFNSISRYSTPHTPRNPTATNTSSSVPIIPRPQGIRCICDFTDYDGFTILCQKCSRYCHAACFNIEKRGDVPADWRCWVCLPDQDSVDKGRAIRLQEARRSRLELESREKNLNRIELKDTPEFKTCASLVRKIFDIVAADTIRLHDAERKTLARSCLSLLLASENMSSKMSPPVDLNRQLQRIYDKLETWGSWSIVKSRIKQKEILATLSELQLEVTQTLASINGDGTVSTIYAEPIYLFDKNKSMARDGTSVTSRIKFASEPAVQVTPAAEDFSVSVEPLDFPLTPSYVSQSVSQHRLYEHLISLLSNPTPVITMEKIVALRSTSGQIASLPLSVALARSRRYRIKLLQLASDMCMSDRPELREALEKDEEYIFGSLSRIIILNEERSAVLRFDEDDAQCFLDLIQMALDEGQFDNENTIKIARRFLIKLSEVSNALPTSLIIHGVELKERDALFGGGFADIYKASYQGKDVAMKRMRVFQRGQDLRKMNRDFCREALIWQRLNHPHVLPFLGVDAETFSPYLCMISPWMQHGTIMRHLSENGNVNVVKRLHEVALGLEYLHSENVVHGDLRGGNILIDNQWQACLADFGLTITSEATALTFTSHNHGSTRWMAPELYDPESFGFAHSRRTPASDVYSFACVCLEVFTGRAPFHNVSSDPAVMLQVMKNKRPQRPPKDAERPLSDDFWNLICKCWAHQPSERLLVTEIVKTMKLWQKT